MFLGIFVAGDRNVELGFPRTALLVWDRGIPGMFHGAMWLEIMTDFGCKAMFTGLSCDGQRDKAYFAYEAWRERAYFAVRRDGIAGGATCRCWLEAVVGLTES